MFAKFWKIKFALQSRPEWRERFAAVSKKTNWSASTQRTLCRADREVWVVCFAFSHFVVRLSTSTLVARWVYRINQISSIEGGQLISNLFHMILYRMPNSNWTEWERHIIWTMLFNEHSMECPMDSVHYNWFCW